MVDVPTPDETGKEAREGNEPASLGDVAQSSDAVRDDEVVPDRRQEGNEG